MNKTSLKAIAITLGTLALYEFVVQPMIVKYRAKA